MDLGFTMCLKTDNVSKTDSILSREKAETPYDEIFEGYYPFYRNEVNFVQKVYVKDITKNAIIEAGFEFVVSTDEKCFPPTYRCVQFFLDSNSTTTANAGKGVYEYDY